MKFSEGIPDCYEIDYPCLKKHFDENLLLSQLICHEHLGIMFEYRFYRPNLIRNNGLIKEQYVHKALCE